MPAQHTRSTGLLCGRPVALELSTGQLERSGSWQGQLQTFAEDASIFTVLIEAFSVLEMFRMIRSTNLLTYLLTDIPLFQVCTRDMCSVETMSCLNFNPL